MVMFSIQLAKTELKAFGCLPSARYFVAGSEERVITRSFII